MAKLKDILLSQSGFLIPILQALVGQELTPGVNADILTNKLIFCSLLRPNFSRKHY